MQLSTAAHFYPTISPTKILVLPNHSQLCQTSTSFHTTCFNCYPPSAVAAFILMCYSPAIRAWRWECIANRGVSSALKSTSCYSLPSKPEAGGLVGRCQKDSLPCPTLLLAWAPCCLLACWTACHRHHLEAILARGDPQLLFAGGAQRRMWLTHTHTAATWSNFNLIQHRTHTHTYTAGIKDLLQHWTLDTGQCVLAETHWALSTNPCWSHLRTKRKMVEVQYNLKTQFCRGDILKSNTP